MATNTMHSPSGGGPGAPPARDGVFHRVYVWEVPVRLFHWINLLCLLVLGATGYLIGSPLVLASSAEASFQYWFGTVRFLHFSAGYVFLFNTLFRLYWSAVGNPYAGWRNYFPFSRGFWRAVWQTFLQDILIAGKRDEPSVGHNPLARASYIALFLLFLFSIASGFSLYAGMSSSWIPGLFAWFGGWFESEMSLRQWHHLALWLYVIFLLVHLYVIYYHEKLERRGIISSIFNGWKFQPGKK